MDPDYSPNSKKQNTNSYKYQRQENRRWKYLLRSLSPPPTSPPPSLDSRSFDSDYSPNAEKQYYSSYIKKQLHRDQQIWNQFKLCMPTTLEAKKSARARAYAFGSSDSDYSPEEYDNESDVCTPQKQKLFSKTDEMKILRGLIRVNKNSENLTRVDDEVARYINRSLGRKDADFTKTQLRSKIRGMKNKYLKNRGNDHEEMFYNLCAKIWGPNEDEVLMNTPAPTKPERLLFEDEPVENDLNVDGFSGFEDMVVEDSYAEEDVANDEVDEVDDVVVEDSYAEEDVANDEVDEVVVEDSYAEEDVANDDGKDEVDEVVVRKTEIEKELKELEVMTMELMLKRLALMKETADAVMEALIRNR